jgi:hypothetical protein
MYNKRLSRILFMIKTFALIGMICVADPSNKIHKENCFNVWETPMGHYNLSKNVI